MALGSHKIYWKHLQIEIWLCNFYFAKKLSWKQNNRVCLCALTSMPAHVCECCWLINLPPPILIVAPPFLSDIVIKEMRVVEHLAACWGIIMFLSETPPTTTPTHHSHYSPSPTLLLHFNQTQWLNQKSNLRAYRQVLRLNISPQWHVDSWILFGFSWCLLF